MTQSITKMLQSMLLFFVIAIIMSILPWRTQPLEPSASPPRTPTSTDVTTIWTQTNTVLPPQSPTNQPFLSIADGCILLINSQENLRCLDIRSGQIKWEIEIDRYGTDITNNETSIFVATTARIRCAGVAYKPECDAIEVTAYDISSGETAWTNIYNRILTVRHMLANESWLRIVGGGGHGAYKANIIIDAITGERHQREKSEPSISTSIPLKELLPTVIAENKDIVSNVAITDDGYYFITDDAVLWAIDKITEQVIGKVSFEPASPTLDGWSNDYQVAAQNETVAVYFGDSQQVFVLNFLQSDQ